jgi:hypothetical protein
MNSSLATHFNYVFQFVLPSFSCAILTINSNYILLNSPPVKF